MTATMHFVINDISAGMHRRAFCSRVACACTAFVAGCTTGGSSPARDGTTDDGSASDEVDWSDGPSVVRAWYGAWLRADPDRLLELTHPGSPLHYRVGEQSDELRQFGSTADSDSGSGSSASLGPDDYSVEVTSTESGTDRLTLSTTLTVAPDSTAGLPLQAGETATGRHEFVLRPDRDDRWLVTSVRVHQALFETRLAVGQDPSTVGETGALFVESTRGIVGEGATAVSEVVLRLALAAGSAPVDLRDVTIDFVLDDTFATMQHPEAEDGAWSTFHPTPIAATDASGGVLRDPNDRYEVALVLEAADSVSPLAAGSEARVDVTTASGPTTAVTVRAPSSLGDASAGDSVSL